MAKKKNMSSVDKTLHECVAMVNYAMEHGQKVPPNVLAALEKFRLYQDYKRSLNAENDGSKSNGTRSLDRKPHPFELFTKNQVVRLDSNTASRGEEVSDIVIPSEEEMVSELSMIHQDMVATVAPATPDTVCLFEDQKRKPLRFLGPVPLVQRMTIVAFLSLLAFLGLFMFDQVDAKTVNTNILDMTDPMAFLLNEMVIISIAAAGASFFALFEAYKYVSNASYDPQYESIYWIRFILGIMSGVILSQFIFISPDAYGGSVAEVSGNSQSMGGFITYKPLLAFLGGFSARVVHKILNSLVESLETFISGSARDMLRAREEQAKIQITEKVATIKRENAINEANSRFQAALKLMKLQEELNGGKADTTQLKQNIQRLIDEQLNAVGMNSSGNEVIPTDPTAPTNTNTTPTTPTNLPVVGPDDIMPGDLGISVEEEPHDEKLHTEPADGVDTTIGNSGIGGEGLNIDLGDSDAPLKP